MRAVVVVAAAAVTRCVDMGNAVMVAGADAPSRVGVANVLVVTKAGRR